MHSILRRFTRPMLAGAALFLTISGGIAHADLPRVAIVATGGTIAGAQTSPQGPGYTAGAFDVGTLIQSVPQLKDVAQITGEQLVKIGSQDLAEAR